MLKYFAKRTSFSFKLGDIKEIPKTYEMKKSVIYAVAIVFSICTFASPVMAAKRIPPTMETTTPEELPPEVRAMVDRLHEIKDMDKSSLTRADKKALRKEVRSIKAALRTSGHGVYLSVGALLLIIIIILLV